MFLESLLALFRTLGHCIRLKTMAITCMMYSGHQSTLPYSRLWTALEDWTCGTLTTILRYKFELYFVWMHVKHMYYSDPISITLLPCRYQQQVLIPNQWRHWTVCGGRIQGTRLPWVTMMVTCSFMTLARWENSRKMLSYQESNIRKFPLIQYLLPGGTVSKFVWETAHLPLP